MHPLNAPTVAARPPSLRSTIRALTALPDTKISPAQIGSLKRLGPQLPGLTYMIPSRSAIAG
jgi:hypothetical protein